MTRTVLVLHPGALGDVLLALPAMRRLRARLPRHQLHLCAGEAVARLLTDCGIVGQWSSIDGSACAALFAGTTPVAGQMKDWLARCDAVVAWVKDEQRSLAAALRRCGVQDVRICSPFSRSLTAKHQSDRFLETIGEQHLNPSSGALVELPDSLMARGGTYLRETGVDVDRPLVVLHPGSGSLHKCVGPEILAAVIEGLRNEGAVPLVLEGPADRTTVADLLERAGTKLVVLRGLDLMTLAGVLAQVQLFVGQDSGVTHLSALLGTRTIVLFGPTDPERWAPIGSHIEILRGPSCSCPDWQAISRCIEKPCLRLSSEAILTLCRIQLRWRRSLDRLPAPCL